MILTAALAVTKPDDKPMCADPEVLPLLDAARDAKGRYAFKIREAFVKQFCAAPCPVRAACLNFALDNNEHGLWGGTTDNQRTRARGHMSFTHNVASTR